MIGAGVSRIKVVLEIIPEMIFKIDLNRRIRLIETDQWMEDNSRDRQLYRRKSVLWLRAYNIYFKSVVGTKSC